MSENSDLLFTKEVEVPRVVRERADMAFAKNRTQGRQKKSRRQWLREAVFRGQAAAIVGACLLGVCSISVAAFVFRHWSRGMQGILRATDAQQQELVEQGTATSMEHAAGYEDMAVTVSGVTVKPLWSIVDGHFAFLSFAVEGFGISGQEEPGFDRVEAYAGDDRSAETGFLNMSGQFYNGIVAGPDGRPVYDSGEPLEYGADGEVLSHYLSEDGALEFVMMLYYPDGEKSLIGETVHVEFVDLGILQGPSYENRVSGTWKFDIVLPGKNLGESYELHAALGESGVEVWSVELSPISIRVDYEYTPEEETVEAIDENGASIRTTMQTEPPDFCGVRLKDGTLLPYLADGGLRGYPGAAQSRYYSLYAFDRVIDTQQVEALLFIKSGPDGDLPLTEDNLYMVPIR